MIDPIQEVITRSAAVKAAAQIFAASGQQPEYAARAVIGLADELARWVLAPLGLATNITPFETSPGPSAPSPSTPTSAPPPTSTPGNPCPNCLEAGRQGTIVDKMSKAGKPFKQCSLKRSQLRNGEWVEIGPCSWFQSQN